MDLLTVSVEDIEKITFDENLKRPLEGFMIITMCDPYWYDKRVEWLGYTEEDIKNE